MPGECPGFSLTSFGLSEVGFGKFGVPFLGGGVGGRLRDLDSICSKEPSRLGSNRDCFGGGGLAYRPPLHG